MIERINLTHDYSVSRIIKGNWQLAGGHGRIDREKAINDMFEYYDAGITTFDCADIYTGVEEMIGSFLKQMRIERSKSEADKVQVHTKYVPNKSVLGKISYKDTRTSILRSIRRLGVENLDLVQFHYWDFDIPGYVEIAIHLADLKKEGLIKHIGLTNFDSAHAAEIIDAGVTVLTNQVQYSVLDHRPEKTLEHFCTNNGLKMLCYGGLAGGLLTEKYLSKSIPNIHEIKQNRSLVKYLLIIEDLGGYDKFQAILQELAILGKEKDLSLSQVAILYILQKPQVGSVIVGARNSSHIDSLVKIPNKKLSQAQIQRISALAPYLDGDIYQLEREESRHKDIMKYNLNPKEK